MKKRRTEQVSGRGWLWRAKKLLMLLQLMAMVDVLHAAPLSQKHISPSPSPSPPSSLPPAAAVPSAIAKPAAPAPAPAPTQAQAPSPSLPPSSSSSIDPPQLAALRSLGVRLPSSPCSSSHDILLCDNASPFRHLIALQLQYCPSDASLSTDALSKLDTLKALSFLDCPMLPVHVPAKLAASLTSFSCIASLGMTADRQDVPGLPGVWLSKFSNLTEIIVTDVMVNTSGLNVILSAIKHVKQIKFSNTNITGLLPVNTWPPNLTSIDLSGNAFHGGIPKTIGKLNLLQEIDLSDNQLTGRVPDAFSKMKRLQKVVLQSNELSGSIPPTVTGLSSLMYLDLSKNKFNGSVPEAINSMKALRYLDLSYNDFSGPLPFNKTFLSKLNTLKVKGNSGICYNKTSLKISFLVGIPNCDSSGLPILPSSASPALSPGGAVAPAGQFAAGSPKHSHGGPKTIVAAVAITLVVIVVFIVVVVLISKCRGRKY